MLFHLIGLQIHFQYIITYLFLSKVEYKYSENNFYFVSA